MFELWGRGRVLRLDFQRKRHTLLERTGHYFQVFRFCQLSSLRNGRLLVLGGFTVALSGQIRFNTRASIKGE